MARSSKPWAGKRPRVAHLVAGGKDRLNAMYMVEGYGENNPIVEKSQFVMSLIEQIDKRGVGPQHKSIIDRCTALVYPEAEKAGRAATPLRPAPEAAGAAGGQGQRDRPFPGALHHRLPGHLWPGKAPWI